MALLLGACAPQPAPSCATPLKPAVEVDLFFGRSIEGGGKVSDAEWADFLAAEVTPRFPNGFTVLDAAGQYREPSGTITREPSKLVVIVVFDAPDFRAKVTALVDVYRKRFRQHDVLRLERPVCAG
ncbi:MAG: DUF3574 domain-containing protein [Proteobacteria bacterium]|nr:DUF3574 domain-containing protein [Pseudomonadota bacterium]